MAKNVASGGFTPVQVGRVVNDEGGKPARASKKEKPAKAAKSGGKVETANVREGNATVGVQADEIRGPLNIGF